MVWYSHFFKNIPQFVVIHTVKGFHIVNEADVFLKFPRFLYSYIYNHQKSIHLSLEPEICFSK